MEDDSTFNAEFDKFRQEQFPRLCDGTVYADWTGAALPPKMLIEGYCSNLSGELLGNPHSAHSPSMRSMDLIEQSRSSVLSFFNADPAEYDVIFTAGATSAILLLQHFIFESGELLLLQDNHNSVNGLREIARRQGAVVRYSPILGIRSLHEDLTIDDLKLRQALMCPRSNGNRLFAYPAKSNYAGTHHSLGWVGFAQQHGWKVLRAAAAYVANDCLDLSLVKPDFVPISFYKMFGFPTGVGALLIRRDAYPCLHKRWFSGGSILLVSVAKDFFAHELVGHSRFEDGTVNFAGIPAIRQGLAFLANIRGNPQGDWTKSDGGKARKGRIQQMAWDLICRLKDLSRGPSPVGDNEVVVHSVPGNDIVTFSLKKDGRFVDPRIVEARADNRKIYLRTGCFCNPGVNETVFGYSVEEFASFYSDAPSAEHLTLERFQQQHLGGRPVGAIRASFGYASAPTDVDRIVDFMEELISVRGPLE